MSQLVLASSTIWSEEHTSELQSQSNLVCRLLLEKKNRTRSWRRNGSAWLPRSLRACRPLCWREYPPSRLLGPWIRLVRGKTHRVLLFFSISRPPLGSTFFPYPTLFR